MAESRTETRSRKRALHDELVDLFERHRLTPVQRRIARYVLAKPEEVVFLAANELAERAGVSQPSVSRLAQAIGFDGYPAMIAHLRGVAAAHPPDGDADLERNRFQEAVADEIANLRTLEESLRDEAAVAALGRDLASSVPLPVLGLRASADLANYFAFFAAKVHPDIRPSTVGGTAVFDALLQARESGAGWLLAVALPRVPNETVAAVEQAKTLGYQVAAITTERFGPLAQHADVLLAVPVGTRLLFDSQAAPMVLAAVLVDAIADAEPGRTQERLEAFEQLAAERRYFQSP
jgi:DNA-binding MurR/RpiR family transcriptional regulator